MGGVLGCCALNMCECAACAACSCFTKWLNMTMSQAARFSHFLIILIVFIIAIVLGQSYPDKFDGYTYYTSIDLAVGCDSSNQDECIYRQLIYRASGALVIVFLIMAAASAGSDMVNKGFWMMKLTATVGLFIAFWWGSNGFFSGWAETTRIISFFWLLVQGLLLLDFAHDIHEVMMTQAADEEKNGNDSRFIYVTYLLLSAGFFTAAIVGLVYLFKDYTGCDLGMFFTILTAIVGAITTFISLLNQVQRGLLTPCVMFAYSVFMCWYALLSSPESSCNPYAGDVNGVKNGAVIIIAVISMVILLYCVFNGTKILNIFNHDGEGVMKSYTTGDKSRDLEAVLTGDSKNPTKSMSIARDTNPNAVTSINSSPSTSDSSNASTEESGTQHERVFFHILMVLVSAYCAMILTSWGATNGAPENQTDSTKSQGNESMWLKIVSQWVFLVLYFKVLHVAYTDNESSSS